MTGAAYQHLPGQAGESAANASTQTRSLTCPMALASMPTWHRVSVRYTLAERRIDIDGGEVYIDAAADRRPLVVTAGGAELRDIGTEFNVLLLPDMLQVGVRSGQVLLDADGADGPGRTHAATRRHRAAGARRRPAAGPPARGARARSAPGRTAWPWCMTPPCSSWPATWALYRDAPVRFADERARGLRLSGTLDLRHPEAFLDALPGLLPVTLSRRPDGSAVIASR